MRSEKFHVMLSEKLQPSVLVIPNDQRTSRLYTFQKATKDYSVRYFRCSSCPRLNRESPVPGMVFAVVVKVRRDELEVGTEMHHPLCLPICNDQIRATEIHRSCKLLAKEGLVPARTAFEQAVKLAATEGLSILAQLGTWKQVSSAYYDAAAQGRNSVKRESDHAPGTTVARDFGSVDHSARKRLH